MWKIILGQFGTLLTTTMPVSEIFSKKIPRITIGLMYFFLLCILWGISFNGYIRKARRKLHSEQYTLEETVNLLREIQPILRYRQSQSKAKEIEF
jgi:hypothetical protein